MTTRIGLLGSCVTRDVWRILQLPTNNLLMFTRTSLASLAAPPPKDFVLPASMGVLQPDGFLARSVRADVAKTALQALEAWQPDVLMFDFIDERFDLIRTENSLVCDSLEFRQSGLRALSPFIEGQLVRRLTAEAETLWQQGLEALRRRIQDGPLAKAGILLHAAFWAESYMQDGMLKPFPERTRFHPVPRIPELVAAHNAMLARYHAAFIAAFPNAIVVTPSADVRIGDAAHEWGLSPHHYLPAYYRSFRDLCRAAGVVL